MSIIFLLFSSINVAAQTPGVIFSEPSGVKTGSFSLSLSTFDPTRQIYYTTNGTVPSQSSTLYTQPITISQSTYIHAISYKNGVADELTSKAGYIYLDAGMQSFSSDLPLLIIENFNQGDIPKPNGGFMGGGDLTEKQFVVAALFEPVNGRTTFNSTPTITTNGGLKVRGTSSATFPKLSYGFDSWNEQSEEKNIEPLGMSKSADWVIFGSQNQDPTYIRSVWLYELSRQMGQWAPDSRPVEVFINTNGGAVTQSDYLGLYFFMEKIGRGTGRLDIEKLDPAVQITDPNISGGYIIKFDRLDAEATGFTCLHTSNFNTSNYYYPKERNMPDYQKPWIREYITTFETALKEIPNSRRYMDYFDVRAAQDHWILKAMPIDADALVLSEFMHKDRGGIIKMGPVWDFDRSAGSVDSRTTNYNSWSGGALVNFMEYGWYGYLHKDPEYFMGLKDRWFQLRQQQLTVTNIDAIIDSLALVMKEAMTRDIQKWPITRFDKTFQGEINHLKEWMHNRVAWIDSQWGYEPQLYNGNNLLIGNSFEVAPGYSVSIQKPQNMNGTIYYTTDGSDPRMVGGSINPSAQTYSNPIVIQNIKSIKARIYNNNTWSPLRQAVFYIEQDLSVLKITEIHYNPATTGSVDGKLLEFIEIKNTGTSMLYLAGVKISNGVDFSFPLTATINPGQILVIAGNAAAFEQVNGFAPDYVFTKSLANEGEMVTFVDFNNTVITEVKYDDVYPWPTSPDGTGFSLVPVSISPIGNQNVASQWRASSLVGGSPGKDDLLIETDPVIITEVLTNAVNPQSDAIELYNPNNNAVNIGGWLLCNNPSLTDAWTIPAGTSIPAKSYLTFYQGHYVGANLQYAANEFGLSFSISHMGEAVYIFAANNGTPTGYSYGFDLETTLPGVSYGTYTTSTNEVHVVPFVSQTFNSANSAVQVGPVVITNIMYNPPSVVGMPAGCEFIMIKNISSQSIKLYDENNPANVWKLNGTSFYFPQNISIAAGEVIYIKSADISDTEFRTRYELTANTQLFTFNGSLNNGGETISIQKPLAPVVTSEQTIVPYATIDKVKYNDQQPWPDVNNNGLMLQRIDNSAYGNDPVNWKAVDGMGKLPQMYTLTVTNGIGSGSYYQYSQINITADAAPTDKVFLKWTGEGAVYISDITAKTTTLTMPGANTTVVAEYADIIKEKVITSGDLWRYNNLGTDLSTTWKENSYADNNWSQGATSLGEEDVITTRISIANGTNKFPTLYFRKTITIANADNISAALLQLKYDDGAVVYINGTEAFRVGMPAGTVTYNTWASASHEATAFEDFQIDPALFITGSNVIAVEVHNQSSTSSDLVFDLELTFTLVPNSSTTTNQFITLNAGWNLVSLYVDPTNNQVQTIFPNATIVKNNNGFYLENQNDFLNTLTTLKAGDAILVKNSITEQIQVEGVVFTGTYVYPLTKGWNIVGVPHASEIELTGLPAEFNLIKDFDAFHDFKSGDGTMTKLKPGKAYFLKVDSNSSLFYASE